MPNFCLRVCVCFFFFFWGGGSFPYGGEKTHKQSPPHQKIPGQSHENFVYVLFFLYVFFFPLPKVTPCLWVTGWGCRSCYFWSELIGLAPILATLYRGPDRGESENLLIRVQVGTSCRGPGPVWWMQQSRSLKFTQCRTGVWKFRAEKDTQTQRFHPKIPCPNPPCLGAFNPRNSLCSGCVFFFEM